MPVYRLPQELAFPDPSLADESGLLAVGGDLSPNRLILAYASGIFPWYSRGEPILWWSPDPRMVLIPGELHVGRSLRKALKRAPYRVTADRAFDAVVAACARHPRPGQGGTWITREMKRAYGQLHVLGIAHSVEAWRGDELVGGLYGVGLGGFFAGESMFATAADASKIAFVHLVAWLAERGCPLIDSQVHTEHLERFGAREIPRDEYLLRLSEALQAPALPLGPWSDVGVGEVRPWA